MNLSGLSFLHSEGRDKTRLHLSLHSTPTCFFFFSDLIVDTEQLRRNGLTACHRRHGCNYEWTFSNGVSIFKKSFVMIIFAYKNNACSLDALSSSMYNLSDVLYAYAHAQLISGIYFCYRLLLFKTV